MSDIGCSCIYTSARRWDDDYCPNPRHGHNPRPRPTENEFRSFRPGQLISIEDI